MHDRREDEIGMEGGGASLRPGEGKYFGHKDQS
jgi:hypothetical protein